MARPFYIQPSASEFIEPDWVYSRTLLPVYESIVGSRVADPDNFLRPNRALCHPDLDECVADTWRSQDAYGNYRVEPKMVDLGREAREYPPPYWIRPINEPGKKLAKRKTPEDEHKEMLRFFLTPASEWKRKG